MYMSVRCKNYFLLRIHFFPLEHKLMLSSSEFFFLIYLAKTEHAIS